MSIFRDIPAKSLPIMTNNRFTAVFNAQGNGRYDFTSNTANEKQTALTLDRHFLYFIDRRSFSASIDEGVYLNSIDTNDQPRFYLYFSQRKYTAYPEPFPAINYDDNTEFNYFLYDIQSNNDLQVTFRGILDQTAATVGIATLYANVSFIIYQIESTKEVLEYVKEQKARRL